MSKQEEWKDSILFGGHSQVFFVPPLLENYHSPGSVSLFSDSFLLGPKLSSPVGCLPPNSHFCFLIGLPDIKFPCGLLTLLLFWSPLPFSLFCPISHNPHCLCTTNILSPPSFYLCTPVFHPLTKLLPLCSLSGFWVQSVDTKIVMCHLSFWASRTLLFNFSLTLSIYLKVWWVHFSLQLRYIPARYLGWL